MMARIERTTHPSRFRGALLPVFVGIILSVALVVLLGFSHVPEEVYRIPVFLMAALVGGSVALAVHLVQSARPDPGLKPLSRWQAIGRFVPHVFASWIALIGMLLLSGMVTGSVNIVGSPLPYLFALAVFGGLGVVAGLFLAKYQRQLAELHKSAIRLKETEFAERELQLARALQQRLLPPAEIREGDFRLIARNYSARYVAGDFFDMFRRADGSLGLVVADVVGKGMAAGLIMASAKAMLPLVAQDLTVNETLVELNRRLTSQLGRREFVALLFASYDPGQGRLVFANAGLPDPYHMSPEGDVRSLVAPGPHYPLGIRSDVPYQSLELRVCPGDRVLFFTDGLAEATTSSDEPLGYERLSALLAVKPTTEGDWLELVLEKVRDETSSQLEDDLTVLLLERQLEPSTNRA